jgi:hypothetical protein
MAPWLLVFLHWWWWRRRWIHVMVLSIRLTGFVFVSKMSKDDVSPREYRLEIVLLRYR